VSGAARIERVTPETAAAFMAYTVAHGPEHDDSFADADELRDFDPAAEVAVVARDRGNGVGSGPGDVVGAASLMVRGYREEGTGRFRILHALEAEDYGRLVDAVLADAPDEVRHVIAFFFEGAPAIEVLLGLGFAPSRYAIVLRRPDLEVVAPTLPKRIVLVPARPGVDDQAWADVINQAFAGFPDRFDITADQAAERIADERLLPGGALLAWRDGEPVGLVAAAEYEEDGRPVVWVDHLAVVPAAQGQGLGRALLRAAVNAARDAGFGEVDLSTGQTNERALSLYTSEGFEPIRRVICLARDL